MTKQEGFAIYIIQDTLLGRAHSLFQFGRINIPTFIKIQEMIESADVEMLSLVSIILEQYE